MPRLIAEEQDAAMLVAEYQGSHLAYPAVGCAADCLLALLEGYGLRPVRRKVT